MPNLESLPPELFDAILNYLNRDAPTSLQLFSAEEEKERMTSLRACALVNRNWYMYATPKLYSAYQCRGDRHPFSRLWYFLRTMLDRPDIACLVEHVDLQDSRVWAYRRQFDRVEEVRIQREAISDLKHRIGRHHKWLQPLLLMGSGENECRRTLYQILLGRLPGVISVHLAAELYASFGGLDQGDFQILFEQHTALQTLQQATLLGSPVPCNAMTRNPCLEFTRESSSKQFFKLPSIRKLAILDVGFPSLWGGQADTTDEGTSAVTHLVISPGGLNFGSTRDASTIFKSWLRLPRTLVSLTLKLSLWFHSRGGNVAAQRLILLDDLWSIAYSHRRTLIHLDIYNDAALYEADEDDRLIQAPFGPMHDFKKLRTLRIQPQVLLGGMFDIRPSSYSLAQSLLPPSSTLSPLSLSPSSSSSEPTRLSPLKHLTLYTSPLFLSRTEQEAFDLLLSPQAPTDTPTGVQI